MKADISVHSHRGTGDQAKEQNTASSNELHWNHPWREAAHCRA